MSRSVSGVINEGIKGTAWGFVAFVHVALVTVLTYKFTLNCLPSAVVQRIACTPPGSAKCAVPCDPANDFFFYALAAITLAAFVLLPLGFGITFAVKTWRREKPS